MVGIYAIHNIINDKYYIGQSIDIKNRWMQHRSRLKSQTHENKHLQSSYNTYGQDAFEYFVVEECEISMLNDKEKLYIKKYNSYNNGYNQDEGGAGCNGYKHTEDAILKMRMIQHPKAVLQIDIKLEVVNEWVSCSHAGKTLGISTRGIKSCCERINHQKTLNGFYWIYKEEYESDTVDWDYYLNINISKPKRIVQFDLQMNFIKIWNSEYEISVCCNYSVSEISSTCNHKKKTYKGFIWRFADDYTNEEYLKDCETDYSYNRNKQKHKVLQYDFNGNQINTYESLSETERITGYSRNSIKRWCINGRKQSNGYIWKYNN